MHIVDTSGWIEYFQSSKRADIFAQAIEDTNHLIVPSISLYEVHKRMSGLVQSDIVETCLQVMRRGQVIELTDARAIAASKTAQAHQLAMADAVMYAAAVEFNAQFWTQDVDYNGLPLVQYSVKSV